RSAAEGVWRAEGPTMQESWRAAVKQHWRDTSMKAAEMGVLIRLGTTRGISDKEDQMKHLRIVLSQLKAEEESARDDQGRYEKMWKSLGVLLAVLIVILMV